MSATKWTPGPWNLGELRVQEVDINCGAEPRLGYLGWNGMATVFGSEDSPHAGVMVMMANANLIAAAPELYEALEEVLMHASFPPQEMQSGEDPFPAHAAIINARAALAKARGEA